MGLAIQLLLPQTSIKKDSIQFIAPKSGFAHLPPAALSDITPSLGHSITPERTESSHSGILQDSFLTHSLMQISTKEPRVPKSIHRYQIKEKLGHGAMGTCLPGV